MVRPDGRITTTQEAMDEYDKLLTYIGEGYGAPKWVDPRKYGLYVMSERAGTGTVIGRFFTTLMYIGIFCHIAVIAWFDLDTFCGLLGLVFMGCLYSKFSNWLDDRKIQKEIEQEHRDWEEQNEHWATQMNANLRNQAYSYNSMPKAAWDVDDE